MRQFKSRVQPPRFRWAQTSLALAALCAGHVGQEVEVEAAEVVRLLDSVGEPTLLPGRTSPPVLGATWDPVVSLTTLAGADRAYLLVSAERANHPIPGVGYLFCTTPIEVVASSTPGTPFAVPIPSHPVLAGRGFCAQGVAVNDNELYRLTANGLDVTIGTQGDLASFFLVESSLDCSNPGFGVPSTCSQMFLGLSEVISLTFNAPVDPTSVNPSSILFYDSNTGQQVPWTFALDTDPRTVLLEPNVTPGFYRLQLTGANEAALSTVRSVFGGRNEDGFSVPLLAF